MLVEQAAIAYAAWGGLSPDTGGMIETLKPGMTSIERGVECQV